MSSGWILCEFGLNFEGIWPKISRCNPSFKGALANSQIQVNTKPQTIKLFMFLTQSQAKLSALEWASQKKWHENITQNLQHGGCEILLTEQADVHSALVTTQLKALNVEN